MKRRRPQKRSCRLWLCEESKVKKFFQKIWVKIKNFFKWLWEQLKDWRTLVIFIIVLLVMYFPAYGFYILSIIFKNGWFAGIATAYIAFWAGPFTPFFPLCIAITFGIKKIFLKIKERIHKKKKDEEAKCENASEEERK